MRRLIIYLFFLLEFISLPVYAQTETNWPMVAGNPQRTSYTPTTVTGNLHVEWYKPIEAFIPLHSQIIAANNRIYVSTANGLDTFDAATGAVLWRFDTELPLGNSPTYNNEVLYVGGYDRKLHAINASNGTEYWAFTGSQAGYDTNPLVINDAYTGNQPVVLLGNRDGGFYAIGGQGHTTKQGQQIWKFQTGGPINFSAAYKNGVVYFASMDNYGYALNISDGSLVWKTPQMRGEGFYSYWPVVYSNPDDGKDYIVYVAADGYRTFTRPGTETLRANTPCNQYEWCEWYDEFSGNVSGNLASGPTNQTWNGNTYSVYNYSKLLDYLADPSATELTNDPYGFGRYHDKSWRRYYYIYNAQAGANQTAVEYTMSYNGKTTYAPVDPYLSNSGNPYPPVANGDGFLYLGNHFESTGISRIAGWRMGTPYMYFLNLPAGVGAGDEPNALSIGGNNFYRSISIDRVADYVNPLTGAGGILWNYSPTLEDLAPGFDADVYCPGSRWGAANYDGLYCNWGGLNGIYWEHGDQNPIVPYNGRLYSFHSNTIIVFGTGTARGNLGKLMINVSPANKGTSVSLSNLKSRLETEISKMVNDWKSTGKFLQPGYYNAGQFNTFYPNLNDYFNFPSETLYTLSEAYPNIDNQTLKTDLKSYLDSYYQMYFSASGGPYGWMGWADGNSRNWAPMQPEIAQDFQNFQKGGTADKYANYALWKYVKNVNPGAASQALSIANRISGNNSNLGGDVYDNNRNADGNVGLSGLNNQSTTVTTCNWFDENSNWTSPPNQYRTLNLARNFMYLTPELGKCFHDSSNGSNIIAAMGRFNNIGPYWLSSRYTSSIGESTTQNLYDYMAMFQAKAWIQQLSQEELSKWLDVPAFKVGDLFYIQNVVAAIEAPSSAPTSTPGPSPTPTVTPTTGPTAIPSPTSIPIGNGDVNNDGKVDLADITTVSSSYGNSTGMPLDQYTDGKINMFDLYVVINRFANPTPTSSLPTPTPTNPPGLPPGTWTLTFSDEFNGTSLDPTKWATKYAYDSGHGDRSNNNEQEWYVDNAGTFSGGILSLTAKRECRTSGTDIYSPYNCTTYPYTSGIISSHNRFSQKYGYFEIRARIPNGIGLWPAFWLLPDPATSPPLPPEPTPWPDANVYWPPEVDIMENKQTTAQQVSVIWMNNIYSSSYPSPGSQINNWGANYDELWDTSQAGDTTDYTAGFHTFGLDWEQNSLTWYIDGVAKHTILTHTPPGSINPGNMYLLANLAVGDQGGNPASTTFPKSLDIDYIRVYQKSTQPTSTPSQPTLTPVLQTPTPTPTGTQVINFNDQNVSSNTPLNGQYPTGVVDWGNGIWLLSPPWGSFTTTSVYFTPTSATFTFLSAKTLLSIDAYNGGSGSSTVTLSCTGNTTRSQSVAAGQSVTISTSWTTPCTTITVGSSNGESTNFDNIVYK